MGRKAIKFACIGLFGAFIVGNTASAAIADIGNWTEAEDPAHPGLSSTVINPSNVMLSASGAIPAGTDIGYQSVNGNSVAGSSSGYYFSAANDFEIAIDFSFSEIASAGLAGIGFGIGEDGTGANSAGVGLAIFNGAPFGGFAGAARTNDADEPLGLLGAPLSASGRFFVGYDASSGDINYGVNTTPGSATASHSGTFGGLQNNWNGDDLLVSFFLRSDSVSIFSSLSSGELDAVFSNFEVLSGSAMSVVPVPGALFLLAPALGLLARSRRNQTPSA